MTRAALSECLAVYVMGNKFSQDPETDDTRTALVSSSATVHGRRHTSALTWARTAWCESETDDTRTALVVTHLWATGKS